MEHRIALVLAQGVTRYVYGPPPMVQDLRTALTELGAETSAVAFEQ